MQSAARGERSKSIDLPKKAAQQLSADEAHQNEVKNVEKQQKADELKAAAAATSTPPVRLTMRK